MINWFSRHKLLILILLIFVSRLPQIFSPDLLLDGDECIVGLMAKHSLEGKGTPIFFYGQSYGFSFVEVIFIRAFYSVFGVSDISVKFAMLSLWAIGIVFFYKTFEEIIKNSKSWLPFIFTLFFIFSPTWAIWSMEARGGYLTAFTLSSLTAFLLIKKWQKPHWVLPWVGLLLVVIYQSQMLWLAGLFPIAIYSLYKNYSLKAFGSLLFGIVLGWVSFYKLSLNTAQFWKAPTLSFSAIGLDSFTTIPLKVYQNLTGAYNQTGMLEMNDATKIWTVIFGVFILMALITAVFLLVKRINISPWLYVFCISVCFTISYLVVLNRNEPRYLLPLFGYALLMLLLLVNSFKINRFAKVIGFTFLFISVYSFIANINYYPSKKQALTHLISELEQRELHYVFCDKGLLQWQIMFYSHESVVARYRNKTDRYPKYIEEVNNAYAEGKKTALVGLKSYWYGGQKNITTIDDWFFIYENPDAELLEKFQFDLD